MKKSSTNGPNRNIRYSAADKLKAVKLFIEDGYPAKQVSEQFGVSQSSLTQWARMYREHGVGAFTTPEDVPKNASAAGLLAARLPKAAGNVLRNQ